MKIELLGLVVAVKQEIGKTIYSEVGVPDARYPHLDGDLRFPSFGIAGDWGLGTKVRVTVEAP